MLVRLINGDLIAGVESVRNSEGQYMLFFMDKNRAGMVIPYPAIQEVIVAGSAMVPILVKAEVHIADLMTKAELATMKDANLVRIDNDIREILDAHELSTDTLVAAVKHFEQLERTTHVRFTTVYQYLRERGFSGRSIHRGVIRAWNERQILTESGSPIGEEHTAERPLHPELDSHIYYGICYLRSEVPPGWFG